MIRNLLNKPRFAKRLPARILLAIFFLGIPSIAHAHGMAVYASTPVTPPRGWLWVPVVFVIGTILLDYFILGKAVSMRKLIRREILFLFIFFVIFFGLGSCAASVHTGPPPGLGLPHKVFYGFSWERAGRLFIFWNIVGLAVFLIAKGFLYWRLKVSWPRRILALLFGNAGFYILALTPFFFSHALTHGWAGPYVRMECRNSLNAVGAGLVRYAEAHDGKLPGADTMEGVMQAIELHLTDRGKGWKERIDVCPAEQAYQRNPRPYEWNTSFAGAKLDVSAEPEANIPVLVCRAEYDAGEVFSRIVQGNRSLFFRDLLKIQAVIDNEEF